MSQCKICDADIDDVIADIDSGCACCYPIVIARMQQRIIELEAQVPKWVSVGDDLPSVKNGYIDELVLIRVRNKNKPDGIWLYDVCAFDGESWCERLHTWESIVYWTPLPQKESDDE